MEAEMIKKITNDNRMKNRCLFLKLCCIMLMALLLAGLQPELAKAASGLKIYNYSAKKTTTYTDKQIKVTYNNATVTKGSTPGILVNGIALVPYDDVFLNSKIAADCKYDSSKDTITISKYNKTLIMKIGSKKATLNGKSVTLPVAPMKIKYSAANKTKVLVPSRYVAENLGFQYTWNSSKSTVAIAKYSLRISYNGGAAFEYSGTQGKVTIDGKSVNLGAMPSIITNNTAMLHAKQVFANSSIKAKYNYNSKDKTITITKGNNVLKMTIGSKKAYLNNKALQLDTAPIMVKNFENNTYYVMVPGEFTATSLGYQYRWDSSSKTSVITSRKDTGTTDGSNQEPELGDSGGETETGTLIYDWKGNDTQYGKSSEIVEITSGVDTTGSTGYIYNAVRDYSRILQNTETFALPSTSAYGKVKATHSGNIITLQVEDLGSTEQIYQMLGDSSTYVNTIKVLPNTGSVGSTIILELLLEDYQYDISLSADNLMLYLTIYKNTVTSASIGSNKDGEYLTLTGLNSLKANVSEQSDFLYIDIPNTVNSIGDINTELSETKYLHQFYSVPLEDKTQFILMFDEDCEYFIKENGNQFMIFFEGEDTAEEEPTEEEPTEEVPGKDIPQVGDKSKYEIVIPRPAGLTNSMISDEDFYLSNYFVIKLSGNYESFYKSNSITYKSNVIKQVSVSLNNSKETIIKIATSKLQGYDIAVDSKNLYINIGDPKEIYKNIVVLDPGHGGAAPGAKYYGTKEKDVNFKILYTIGKQFFNSDTSKLKVYYTRTSDVDVSLNDRAAFAKKVGADLFVSLHMNAAEILTVSGTEVYYSDSNNKANKAGLTSKTFASYFQGNLTKTLGTKSRGVKEAPFVVVKKNTVPAVLIELGFLSNSTEHSKLTNEEYQTNAVKIIYETILQVFKDYPTKR